jgi:hypothetical protein
MTLDPVTELETLVDALETEGAAYAVCGGLALAVHGHPRATKDIDLLVPGEEVDRVIAIAKSIGFDIPARLMTFGLRTGTPREMRRISKLDRETGDLIALDVIVVAPDMAPVWAGRLVVEWRARTMTVVSRDGLIAMKRIAGRPQDLADVAKLEGVDDDGET